MAHSTVEKKSLKAEEHASAKRAAPTSVQSGHIPVEPEDARLLGAGTEEQQRLLKKNIEEGKAERHPDLPAGIHSTGSFTGENEKKK
jgi:hypothetical protein